MRKKKVFLLVFCLQIALCLLLNWAGDQLVSRLNWPVWLDSVGTVLSAYLLGPVCGAIVGATSNLLAYIFYGVSPMYALVSIVIGVVVGIASKRKKLETMLGTLTTGAILAGCVAVAAYPLNMILNNASTGSNWGDAIIGFLEEMGFARWLTLLIGELYMELLDKVLILMALFVITRVLLVIRRKLRPDKDTPEEDGTETEDGEGGSPEDGEKTGKPDAGKAAVRTAALLLAAGLCLNSAAVTARAAVDEDASEINYNDYVQTIYSSTNGLPCGEANAIAQTGDGIMWIGTYAGLYRYNGREFRWMDGFDSVRNVNCLYVDEEGRLWIGTNDNGLSIVINEQVVNVIDQSDGLPSNSVKSIIKSSDGY